LKINDQVGNCNIHVINIGNIVISVISRLVNGIFFIKWFSKPGETRLTNRLSLDGAFIVKIGYWPLKRIFFNGNSTVAKIQVFSFFNKIKTLDFTYHNSFYQIFLSTGTITPDMTAADIKLSSVVIYLTSKHI